MDNFINHNLKKNRILQYFKKNKIFQYGFPGSGSTQIYQILKYLFNNVTKLHKFVEYNENIKVVATVRDFRDCLCTYFKRRNIIINKENLKNAIDRFMKGEYHFVPLDLYLKEWSKKENILWLRYEDFFNNDDYIFAQLEDFFNLKITEEQREYIQLNYSMLNNKERSKSFQSFTQYDPVSQIHGNHITANGQINKWIKTIPENLHGLTNQLLEDQLKKWEYI